MSRNSPPPASSPMPSPSTHGAVAATEASTLTPGAPLAFMTTTAQLPDRSFHCRLWAPTPWAEATQIRLVPGGAA